MCSLCHSSLQIAGCNTGVSQVEAMMGFLVRLFPWSCICTGCYVGWAAIYITICHIILIQLFFTMVSGLLAKKAVEAGLTVAPYIKTSLSPGSGVVTYYLKESGVIPFLKTLGFEVVGYGCMTCIGNSGPLDEPIVDAIEKVKVNTNEMFGIHKKCHQKHQL